MREIKFRAWSDGRFEYSDPTPSFSFWKWCAYDSTTVIEQFVGLHDKKGKEIYEGDITENERNERCVIEFIKAAFSGRYLNGFDWDPMEQFDGLLDRHVIIGNIHENGDLLSPSV